MVTQNISQDNWLEKLLNLKNTEFTGQFFIKSPNKLWTFHLSVGWIFYIAGGSVQKWQRRLLLHHPQLEGEKLLGNFYNPYAEASNFCDYHLLFSLFKTKKLSLKQAQKIVMLSVFEAFYEVLYNPVQQASYQIESNFSEPLLIMFDPEELVAKIREISGIFASSQISGSPFELAPVLRRQQALPSIPKTMEKLMDGRHTVWDIAVLQQVNVDVIDVAREVIPLVIDVARQVMSLSQEGMVELIEIDGKSGISSSLALSEPLVSSGGSKTLTKNLNSVSEYEQRNDKSILLKKSHQRRGFSLIPLGGAFLSLLLLSGGCFLLWKMRFPAFKSSFPSLAIPVSTSDIQLYNSMREVPKVPKGLFNYGGALLFAPLRSQKVINTLAQAQPQFHLRYVDPVYGRPGSHKGVAMLINNELSLSQNALPLNDFEYSRARTRGFTLQEVPVAIDAVTFFTHPGIDIAGLSVDQLQDIFTGKITNWQQVGGPDLPIVPITIDPKDSSTMTMLMENVPGGVSSVRGVKIARDYTAAIRLVSANPGGISFGSVGTIKGQRTIRPLSISKVHSTLYISPYNSQNQINSQAFRDGSYPLTRNVFVVIRRDGTPNEQAGVAYTNLLLSSEGQRLVEQAGFIALH